MHLVEAEAVGPVEGDEPLVTPPRPPHRRVSVSLLFTMTVLIGTVVAIYMTFPARHDALLETALAHHRRASPVWDLPSPTATELRAWVMGFAGSDAPLPPASTTIRGARRVVVLDRDAAVIGLEVGGQPVTYVLQVADRISPASASRSEGELHAIASRVGRFTVVGVGPRGSHVWQRALR